MNRKLLVTAAMIFAASLLFAYNPPNGGEMVFNLTEPNMLSGYSSASGGPAFCITPASIVNNPALTGFAQRNILDLSAVILADGEVAEGSEASKIGGGFSLGLTVPTKWCVATAVIQGTFVSFPEMDLGNQITIHAGLAKDVSEKLSVGTNLYTGFYMGSKFDWTLGLDVGFLYNLGNVSFIQDSRLGVSLTNLGKPIINYPLTGIDGTQDGVSYPNILTPRGSFAGTLFKNGELSGGFSADLYAPFFQNIVFDASLAISYGNLIKFTIGWEANLRELLKGAPVDLPSIGIMVNFTIHSKKISELSADWAKSEIGTSAAWKRLYGNVHAISTGCIMNLGLPDTTPPEIILWDEE